MVVRKALSLIWVLSLTGAVTTAAFGQTRPQSGAPAPSGGAIAQTGGTRVHGTITDPDGELIPGASVTLTPEKGSPVHAKTGSDGTYSTTVPPGVYGVLVTMQGFSQYSATGVRINAGPSMTLDAKLKIGEQTEVINVETNSIQLSVDQDNNASSTVLKGDDLNALSDDPDELTSELQALAGPASGPNGGQIYVDGFTGGQLPPKSSIREIRINQNPFSAQYDRLGYGRVEVFTKPGTDKLHGNVQLNYDPSQFNTGTPPNGGEYQPPYHTLFIFGSITGPLSKSASYNLGGSHRDIEQDEFTYANALYAPSPGSTTLCAPGQAGCVISTSGAQVFTYNPRVRTDINPRLDFALGTKNVLTVRYQYVMNDELNDGIGNLTLPSAGFNTSSKSNIVQISETQTYSTKFINEDRFEYERERSSTTALSNAPTVNVSGSFIGGGYSGQNASDHQDHFELQDYASLQLKKNFIRMGGRLRTTREAEFTSSNTNGVFTYASINDYSTSTPSLFSISRVNVPTFRYTLADLGLYVETDWKPISNLTVSYGLRYETQNNLPDHHDVAPRVSFAYGLGSGKGAPKTVLRGGYGFFFDRYTGAQILNTVIENGANETIFTSSNAQCVPFSAGYSYASCTAGLSANTNQIYTRTANLRTPYTEQFAFGIDRQVSRFGTVSVNYLHALGVHQFASQNVGYNLVPASYLAAQSAPPYYQYFSEGEYHQNQLVVNARVQTTKWLSLFGYYSLGFAAGDISGITSGPNAYFISTPNNIHADYGRTTFDTRSHAFLAGSVTLPHFIQFSPYIQAQSGNPYNITLGSDADRDTIFNDRPYLLPSGTAPATGALTKTIPGCGTFTSAPVSGSVLTPTNDCTGPSLFTFNFRLTKTFGFGERRASTPGRGGANRAGGGGGFGPPGGGRGGPPGGGPGGANTGRRYNLGVGVMVQNLFGNNDLAAPNGVLTSPNFGISTQLTGGAYTTTDAVRRIAVQASFTF